MNPQLVTVENPQDLPILIVDKRGIIGQALTEKLSAEFLTIFVNGREKTAGNNIIHVPYRHKIPNIPDNLFSYIFVISEDEKDVYSHVKTLAPKARANNAHIIVVLPSALTSDKFLLKLQYHFPEVMIVVHGDLFGGKEHLSVVDTFLEAAGSQGSITISKSGLEKSYPMYFSDAVVGIIRAVFSQFHQGEIFLLLPNFFVSDISLTRMFKKELTELEVLVTRKTRSQATYCIPRRGIYIYQAYDLEVKLHEALRKYQGIKRVTRQLRNYTPSRLSRVVSYTKAGLWFSGIIFMICMLILGVSYIGVTQVLSEQKEKKVLPLAFVTRSDLLLRISEQVAIDITPLATVVGMEESIAHTRSTLSSALRISRLQKEFSRVRLGFGKLGRAELNPEELERLRSSVKNVVVLYASLSPDERKIIDSNAGIQSGMKSLVAIGSLIDLFPQMTGLAGKKTYLILLPDNTELRGSGGVVETYGLVTVAKGKIENITFKDANELDITLKDVITPPGFIESSLENPKLGLRDSLYSHDFPTGASQANLIYYLATQQRIDGIIAVDMTFLEQVLKLKKGTQIAGFDTPLTTQNFIQHMQTKLANKDLPSSPEKKAKLAQVYTALLQTFIASFSSDPVAMLDFSLTMLEKRHLQFYSEEPGLENMFLASDMTATTKERRVRRVGGFSDFLGVHESNVGKNNANFYLKRGIEHKVTLSNRSDVNHVVAITYENTSPLDDPMGGEYKSYVEVVAPKNARLEELAIDGTMQTIRTPGSAVPATRRGRVVAPSMEVATSQDGERTIFGFYIHVPPAEKRQIVIGYVTPGVVALQNGVFVYDYLLAKQSGGKDEDTFQIGVDYPETLLIKNAEGNVKEEDMQLISEGKLEKDVVFHVVFSEK